MAPSLSNSPNSTSSAASASKSSCPITPATARSLANPPKPPFYATADAAYDYLVNRCGIPPQRIVCVGKSLERRHRHRPRLPPPGRGSRYLQPLHHHPRHGWPPLSPHSASADNLPIRQPLKKIAHVTCPIFLCNGLSDTFVPPEMSDRLASSATAPVTRLKIPTADHNTIFTADPEARFRRPHKISRPMKGG